MGWTLSFGLLVGLTIFGAYLSRRSGRRAPLTAGERAQTDIQAITPWNRWS